MKESDSISIIVVFYNPSKIQIKCIERLSDIYFGVIVDNSPKPIINSDRFGKFDYIYNNANLGIAKAQNIGLQRVLSHKNVSFIVFLDQDSVVPDNYPRDIVNEYLRVYSQKRNLAALGPMLTDGISDIAYASKIHKIRYLAPDLIFKRNIISSGCCISRVVLEDVGMFEENLFIDLVDSEWCWRAGAKGYVCCISTKISIVHSIGKKRIRIGPINDIVSVPFRYFYQYRNYIWMLRRKYVPKKWKFFVGVKYMFRLIYVPLLTENGFESCKFMLKGIFYGLVSK